MHWVALFFIIGAIISVAVGDYVEAVGGVAVAVIISFNASVWGKYTDSSVSTIKRIGLSIAITALIAGFAFFVIKILEEIEIFSETYVQVTDMQAKYPRLNEEIRHAMEDGKISIVEYYDIEERSHLFGKEMAIKAIMEGLQK